MTIPGAAGPSDDSAGSPVLPDNETIFSWVKDLAAFCGRGTQTLDDRRSADYLVDAFQRFGLTDVHIQETESLHWNATSSGLTVGGVPIPHGPAAWSLDTGNGPFSTGSNGLTAPIIDIGDGGESDFAEADVTGKIVLFNLRFLVPRSVLLAAGEFIYNPDDIADATDLDTANPYLTNFDDVLERAIAAGATGFIGVLSDYFDSHDIRPEYTPDITVPGVWVTKTSGARVRTIIASRPVAATATIHLAGERTTTTARTVIGYLPGQSTDAIMIQSHHDSAWDGGVEDASGTAEVLALAQYYSQVPEHLRPRTLMFVLMDSHWTGYQAHEHFVETYIANPLTAHKIVANITVEHIAKQAEIGPDGQLQTLDRPEYRAIFENVSPPIKTAIQDAVTTHDLRRTIRIAADDLVSLLGELPTDADHVYQAGVPTICFISGPLYLYDKADTIDKVYVHDLAPVARAFADIIDCVAVTPSDQIRA